MEFSEVEATSGLRFSWNVWPSSRIDAARVVVPFGAMITPLKNIPGMPVLPYEPVCCKGCKAVLNPYCRVDFVGKIWICVFCHQRNQFPRNYADISETSLPAELFPNYTTIEYKVNQSFTRSSLPAFLFVVDTCLSDEELQGLKDTLRQTLSLLPESALVGLISFGTVVSVHEIGYGDCPKAHVFRGDQEISGEKVQDQLGIGFKGRGQPSRGAQAEGATTGPGGSGGPGVGRFLLPVSECEFALESALEDLTVNSWPKETGHRHKRATGAALSVAVGLLESCCPSTPARLMLVVGGPCTHGPGTVLGTDVEEHIRSHQDFEKNNAKHFKKALKFYTSLGTRLFGNGHVMDVYAAALDQEVVVLVALDVADSVILEARPI
eukprot:gene10763-12734_t